MRKYLLIALNVIALLGISSMAFAAGATLDAAALGTTCLGAALGIGFGAVAALVWVSALRAPWKALPAILK